MELQRRTLLAVVGTLSAGLAGCFGSEVTDLAVYNETGRELSATVVARVGDDEERSWSPTIATGETWTWDGLGERELLELEVSASDGPSNSRSWGDSGAGGQGVTVYVKTDRIEILETTQ